jgi:hypothetical protein
MASTGRPRRAGPKRALRLDMAAASSPDRRCRAGRDEKIRSPPPRRWAAFRIRAKDVTPSGRTPQSQANLPSEGAQRSGDRRIFVRPVEPGAGQQPDLGAIDPGVHAISIALELVRPILAAWDFLHRLTEPGLIHARGSAFVSARSWGDLAMGRLCPTKKSRRHRSARTWSDHRGFSNSRSRGLR